MLPRFECLRSEIVASPRGIEPLFQREGIANRTLAHTRAWFSRLNQLAL
jgi:hypothetical protein